jgi:hypothetical protein
MQGKKESRALRGWRDGRRGPNRGHVLICLILSWFKHAFSSARVTCSLNVTNIMNDETFVQICQVIIQYNILEVTRSIWGKKRKTSVGTAQSSSKLRRI